METTGSPGTLRFGLMYLQASPFADVLERVRRGEEMGFDSIWVADHMTGQYPTLVSFEAWSLLGALAMATSRATIGPLVTPITFRHPALLAMAATTVDHASGGRLEIGLGIGGAPVDGTVVGVDDWPASERVARLEEQVDLLDRLFRGQKVDEHAGFYPTSGAVIEPSLHRPRPPLVIAGDGPRLIDLAARKGDAWNTLGGQPPRGRGTPVVTLDEAIDATRRRVDLLEEACARAGRPLASIRRLMLAYRAGPELFQSADAFTDYVSRYRDIGINEFIFYWPVDPATFEQAPAYERALETIAGTVLQTLRAG